MNYVRALRRADARVGGLMARRGGVIPIRPPPAQSARSCRIPPAVMNAGAGGVLDGNFDGVYGARDDTNGGLGGDAVDRVARLIIDTVDNDNDNDDDGGNAGSIGVLLLLLRSNKLS